MTQVFHYSNKASLSQKSRCPEQGIPKLRCEDILYSNFLHAPSLTLEIPPDFRNTSTASCLPISDVIHPIPPLSAYGSWYRSARTPEVSRSRRQNTREAYEAYRKTGYSKKFYAEHGSDILLHKAAKKAFDELGAKKNYRP